MTEDERREFVEREESIVASDNDAPRERDPSGIQVQPDDLLDEPPDALPVTAREELVQELHGVAELRIGETDDPGEAAEEGLTWVPPSDPPSVGVEDDGDPRIAAGFSTSALDEPYDQDHHQSELPSEDEMTARVREALLADASTAGYADDLSIETEAGVVYVSGTVADLSDEDDIVAVISTVSGVTDVRSDLRVLALE